MLKASPKAKPTGTQIASGCDLFIDVVTLLAKVIRPTLASQVEFVFDPEGEVGAVEDSTRGKAKLCLSPDPNSTIAWTCTKEKFVAIAVNTFGFTQTTDNPLIYRQGRNPTSVAGRVMSDTARESGELTKPPVAEPVTASA
jgi:hypothetical protein